MSFHSYRTLEAPTPTALKDKASSIAKSQSKLPQAPQPGPATAKEKWEAATKKSKQRLEEEQREALKKSSNPGSLASGGVFSDDETDLPKRDDVPDSSLAQRNPAYMAQALNPNPPARARWQRRMVIRQIRHGGRLNKEMKIARSERSHTSRSHFFKTSIKKLAPLARQIAGKPIDEAILQMRFSKKKVAQDVRQHLIQARNEAIAIKGMGLGLSPENEEAVVAKDPSETPPLPHQTPRKTNKKSCAPSETDIYIAQAWVNRGQYGREPDFRARGRVYTMHLPHTGISVLLKEEKTRMRERAEKEAKALKKRMGKNMWIHLPDRKITTQRQHLLW